MATVKASNAISETLLTLHNKHGYRSEQYLGWAIDDYLADLTGKKKENPPPVEVMQQLRELGRLYAEEVARSDPFSDILGRTYMDLVSSGGQKSMAQFFTPEPLARVMAEMAKPNRVEEAAKGDLYRVMEPACGAGIMILQLCSAIAASEGFNALQHLSLCAIDLDPLCCKMTAVQLLANTLINEAPYGELIVLHGNALDDPTKLKTIVHASHARWHGHIAPAQHPARIEALKAAVEATPHVREKCEEQLALF